MRCAEKLPSHARLIMYSYLKPVELVKACCLSKQERNAILQSKLIDKELDLSSNQVNKLLELSQFQPQKLDFFIRFCSSISFNIDEKQYPEYCSKQLELLNYVFSNHRDKIDNIDFHFVQEEKPGLDIKYRESLLETLSKEGFYNRACASFDFNIKEKHPAANFKKFRKFLETFLSKIKNLNYLNIDRLDFKGPKLKIDNQVERLNLSFCKSYCFDPYSEMFKTVKVLYCDDGWFDQ